MKYKIILYYDKEYKGYYVDVPQLPGCMSQGKTVEECIANVKDAIKGWLFVEEKNGRTITSEIDEEIFLGEVII